MINFHANADFYANARLTIQGNEGASPQVYADSSNLPTIGYGYALIIKIANNRGQTTIPRGQ